MPEDIHSSFSCFSPLTHLTQMSDLTTDQIWEILEGAQKIKSGELSPNSLDQKIIAHLFYEPSTRTRLSFEAATLKLGGQVIGFSDAKVSSSSKGESLADTIRVISSYSDAIVLRHPEPGAAACAAKISNVPIINAGDGDNEHPTQTLLDLFTLWETQGRLDRLHIGLCGDLKYSRTVHSLIKALCQFGKQYFYVLSPEQLKLPASLNYLITQSGSELNIIDSLREAIPDLNSLYLTRLQKERFINNLSKENTENIIKDFKKCILNLSDVGIYSPYFKILHPLPRGPELPIDIDRVPAAYYFEQAENGLYVRQSLLAKYFKWQ